MSKMDDLAKEIINASVDIKSDEFKETFWSAKNETYIRDNN
jgi:hypothetical protein